ncbi:hypothetical protein Ddc_14855 [Ditylenchus destructor]|nr:hypothetical protein Ddc_14855 [Ditylenchus destructor]
MPNKEVGAAVTTICLTIAVGIALTVFLSTYQRDVNEYFKSDESSKSAYDSFNEDMFKYALLAYFLHLVTSLSIVLGAHRKRAFYATAVLSNIFTTAMLIFIVSVTPSEDFRIPYVTFLIVGAVLLEMFLVIAYLFALAGGEISSNNLSSQRLPKQT